MPLLSSDLASCAALDLTVPWVRDLTGTLMLLGQAKGLIQPHCHCEADTPKLNRWAKELMKSGFTQGVHPLTTSLGLPLHPFMSLVLCPGAGDVHAVAASNCLGAHCLSNAHTLIRALPNMMHHCHLQPAFSSVPVWISSLRHCLLFDIWGCNCL